MVLGGHHGTLLRVDVGRETAVRTSISDDVLRRYLGGVGLGTRLLLDEGRATDDPLAPASPFIVVLSPLVGSPLTTSAFCSHMSQLRASYGNGLTLVTNIFGTVQWNDTTGGSHRFYRAAEPAQPQ